MTATALATVLHDPDARLAEPLTAAAPALRGVFSALTVCVTEATPQHVLDVFTGVLGAKLCSHPTGEAHIGLGRRRAVGLALETDAARILYSDIDHLLRWLQRNPGELQTLLEAQPEAGMLIIGRSARAFSEVPRRLRETEAPINHAYALMTGREADLLFAVRRMDRAVAADIVAHAIEDTLANDVEWPLLAEQFGHTVGYAPADGLVYRALEDFEADRDSLDDDPLQWIRRIEFAADMARVLRRYL